MHAAMATLHSNRALPTNADVYRIDRRLADTADPPRSMPAGWTFCDYPIDHVHCTVGGSRQTGITESVA